MRWPEMNRRWGWGIVTIVVVVAIVVLYRAGLIRLNVPSPERFPLQGIDVSRHQGHIGWFEASLHGVRFAYLKATEGADFRDPQFLYNWSQCPYNGIRRGAYHFFNFCRDGTSQARNFLRTVPHDAQALPPALDLEFSPNCRRVPTRAEMKKIIADFVTEVSKQIPGRPVFYITPDFYKRYIDGRRDEFPPHILWIRNVIKEPSLKPCSEWTFWQFADNGRIPGIHGPVDLNVFCGSQDQFTQFFSTAPATLK
jgi:lysozyme